MAPDDLLAERLNRIQPSQTIAISSKARAMRDAGRKVIALSSGEPDFDTPTHIKDAAKAALDRGETKYTDTGGIKDLRIAVARSFATACVSYEWNEVIAASGAKQIIFNALLATLEAGDEVIVPTPCWVSYPEIVSFTDGSSRLVSCPENNGFRLRAEDLEAAITPRTKWLIINNPCNPTGAAYNAEQLRPICDVLLRHPHVWVMTDDIYDKLVYDGAQPATITQVEPSLAPRTLTINGCSKAYAMTGWRLGFAAGPRKLIAALEKLQSQSTGNPSSISQAAALAALRGPQDFIAKMVAVYQQRRDMVVGMLNDAAGVTCRTPEGAFYVFPSLAGCLGKRTRQGVVIKDDEAFVSALLEEEGVAVVHGGAFLASGYFRISYAADTELLRDACSRIQRFCASMTK